MFRGAGDRPIPYKSAVGQITRQVTPLTNTVKEMHAEAHQLLEAKDWAAAREIYEKILESDPSNEQACRKLAGVYAVLGLVKPMGENFTRLIEILADRGELDAAQLVVDDLLKLEPGSTEGRMKRIQLLRRQDRGQEATDLAMQVSRLLIAAGDSDNAIMLLQDTQETVPDNLDVGLELADCYISHGHIDEGISRYRNLAGKFVQGEQYERAAEVYNRMKIIQVEGEDYLFDLGNIFITLNRLDEAENEFRSILRLNLDNIKALTALANVCEMKGQVRDAILAYRKIVAIDASHDGAKEKLEQLMASVQETNGTPA